MDANCCWHATQARVDGLAKKFKEHHGALFMKFLRNTVDSKSQVFAPAPYNCFQCLHIDLWTNEWRPDPKEPCGDGTGWSTTSSWTERHC